MNFFYIQYSCSRAKSMQLCQSMQKTEKCARLVQTGSHRHEARERRSKKSLCALFKCLALDDCQTSRNISFVSFL